MEEKIIVICTRLLHGYKLTFCVNIKPLSIKEMINPKIRKDIVRSIKNKLKWWVEVCKKHALKIVEIEIILPPTLEYADLEKEIKDFFSGKKIHFSIAIGLKISMISDEEDERDVWEGGLEILGTQNTNLN